MLLLVAFAGAFGCGGLGYDAYCQSGPKYGTQCYTMGGPSTDIKLPPTKAGSVQECAPVGEHCETNADCCKAMTRCSAGLCVASP